MSADVASVISVDRPLPTTACVIWSGCIQANGYGRVNGRGYAHRVAYEQVHGPIPRGLHIDHICRVRSCVNPEHLEAVSQKENNRRAQAARSHCRYGHPLDGVKPYPGGLSRCCTTCIRQRNAARYPRKEAS
jgi:hypothetical protein